MPDQVPAGARVRVGDINQRAPFIVAYESITSSTGTTTSSSPQAAITTDPVTFRDGRAYRIAYRGGLSSSTLGQQATVLVARGTAAGTVILNSQRIMCASGAAGTIGFYFVNNVVNNTGADITTVLVGTYHLVFQVSSGTVNIFGSSTTPSYVEVTDIGPADDCPGATPL